jgi:hypothetical protein
MKRCPHCQTRPLRADADSCWYCGREFSAMRKTTGSLSRADFPMRALRGRTLKHRGSAIASRTIAAKETGEEFAQG